MSPKTRDKTLCIDCRVEKATEFYAPNGRSVKLGYCRRCYEKSIRNSDLSPSVLRREYKPKKKGEKKDND